MSKEDARRLGGTFEELKNNVVGMLKSGAFSGLSTRFSL
jgi:hypothetical protein